MSSSVLLSNRPITNESTSQNSSGKENLGKQHGTLPSKTPRKVLGNLKNSSLSQNHSSKKPSTRLPPTTTRERDSVSANRQAESKTSADNQCSVKRTVMDQTCNDSRNKDILTEREYIPEPVPEKKDVYHPPSFVQGLRMFRPMLYHRDQNSLMKDVTFEDSSFRPEPTRVKTTDEEGALFDHMQSNTTADMELPDIADLDILLTSLS